jgi:hypothetical protein
MTRIPTIRETAHLMDMGIRIYRSIPFYAYIVRVRARIAVQLEGVEPVGWMAELRPEDKYSPTKQFENGYPIAVYTLPGDIPECRTDLEHLGAEILGVGIDGLYHHNWAFYEVRVDVSRVGALASLWWVHMINQAGRGAGPEWAKGQFTASDSSGLASSFSSNLRPDDSRRLVSREKDNRFRGYNQSVLIYEFACDWNHPDLRSNILPGSSLASASGAAAIHGTMVAGITVGLHNATVNGGGVGGVAPGATFRYLLNAMGSHSAVSLAAEDGLWLQNHSWGMFQGQYVDSLGVYTQEARAFDEIADEHGALLIKSAGNQGCGIPRTITSPGTGKNVIAVGAIQYVTEGAYQDTLGMIASYSSLGPTRTDILKPELVAPGGSSNFLCPRTSACAERGVVSCGTGTPDACNVWDSGYKYVADIGTSFAAPHVTGTAAVVAEAYEEWYRSYHYFDHDYALSGELMRALLINSAIPLTWNGTWPNDSGHFGGSPGDTLATAATLSGFANTAYGYGLVNAYSGVHSPDSEYRRVLVWQGTVQGVGDVQEKEFSLLLHNDLGAVMCPRYLFVTLAYNDLPDASVVDRLELSLQDPALNTLAYAAPSGLVAGTVQKMIVPWPKFTSGGGWKAKVKFAGTSSSRPFPDQSFAVVVDAMLDAPRLAVSADKSEYYVRVGINATFSPRVTVTNIGGNVAAGVTMRIEDVNFALPPGGDEGKTVYVGNLLKNGAKASQTFNLPAPLAQGDFQIVVKVDAINKVIDGGPYPITKVILIKARENKVVYGKVAMGGSLPGFNTTVQGADILVNGVKVGEKTNASGQYSVEVEKNFAGIIKPRKGTTVFFPPQIDYSSNPIVEDATGQDYEAEYRVVTGRILDENGQGVANITVSPRPDAGSDKRASPGVTTMGGGLFTCYTDGQKNEVHRKDVFEFLEGVECDILYLDPPYAGTSA